MITIIRLIYRDFYGWIHSCDAFHGCALIVHTKLIESGNIFIIYLLIYQSPSLSKHFTMVMDVKREPIPGPLDAIHP